MPRPGLAKSAAVKCAQAGTRCLARPDQELATAGHTSVFLLLKALLCLVTKAFAKYQQRCQVQHASGRTEFDS